MHNKTVAIVIFALTTINVANSAEIPKRYHGRWNIPGECGKLGSGETEVIIKQKGFESIEYHCNISSIVNLQNNAFKAKYKCKEDGDEKYSNAPVAPRGFLNLLPLT